LLIGSSGALAPALFTLGGFGLSNLVVWQKGLEAGLWNYRLGLLSLIAFGLECALLGAVLLGAGRLARRPERERSGSTSRARWLRGGRPAPRTGP
jgi:hypothetical protein